MSKRLVLLSLAITGLAACGSDNQEMTVAEFTQKISQGECTYVAEACMIQPTVCLSIRQSYWSGVANDAIGAGHPFDPNSAETCLAKVKSLYKDILSVAISAEAYRDEKLACDRVFHGSAKENEPCGVSVDCVDSLVCDKGFCGHRIEVGPGKQCANIGEYCNQGFTCVVIGTGPVRQCVARAKKGEACTGDDSCMEGLRCPGGECIDGLETASDCQADKDCESEFCEPFAHKCSNSIRFSEGGSACLAFQSTTPIVPTGSVDASVD
jgi:hypothetical protein